MTLLLIGLIISMAVMAYKTIAWIKGVILLQINSKCKTAEDLKTLGVGKNAFIFGGVEHLILLGSLIAATIIIY